MVVGRGKKGRGVASSRTTKAARKRVQGLCARVWVGVSALALLSVVAGGGLSGTGEPAPAKKEKKKRTKASWKLRLGLCGG